MRQWWGGLSGPERSSVLRILVILALIGVIVLTTWLLVEIAGALY